MQNTMQTKDYLIRVIAAMLAGTPVPPLPNEVDFASLCKLAFRNAVQSILYLAFREQKDSLPPEAFARLEKSYQAGLMREVSQQEELRFLREAFSSAGIDFMLLKGTHLKALYPASEMRFMVDMDVLVHEQDVSSAMDIILSRGFTAESNNGKDIILIKKPFLTIELHHSLFQEDYFMYPYFCGVWDRAKRIGAHEYGMTNEDLYVYTLAHLAEHYTTAGSCFRPVMDLFLMEQKHADTLDFAYIREQFQTLGIAEFAENVRALGRAMFSGAAKNDTLTMMENYVTLGPPVQNAAAASHAALTQKSKARRILDSAFPSFKHMALKYPILRRLPILLPFFWLIRLIQFTFTKDKAIVRKRKELKNADQKSADTMQKIFRDSGL